MDKPTQNLNQETLLQAKIRTWDHSNTKQEHYACDSNIWYFNLCNWCGDSHYIIPEE